jgi:hypothetical protein
VDKLAEIRRTASRISAVEESLVGSASENAKKPSRRIRRGYGPVAQVGFWSDLSVRLVGKSGHESEGRKKCAKRPVHDNLL